jgi:hypothetical protein
MPLLSHCDYGPKLRINSPGRHHARMLTEENTRLALRSFGSATHAVAS